MNTMKKLLAATAVIAASMMPVIGSAEAKSKHDGFRGNHTKVVKHKRFNPRARHNRGNRFNRIHKRPDFRHYSVHTPHIDARIERQAKRIRRGRARGRLSRFEAVRLRSRLISIRSARSFARLDGRVTRTERSRLNHMLDRNSNRIRRMAHNGFRRF